MRMPRLRFTVRRTMVAVAIVVVPLAGIARSRYLASIARHHGAAWASIIDRADAPWNQPVEGPGLICGMPSLHERTVMSQEERDRRAEVDLGRDTPGYRLYRRMTHHSLMARKYEEAACYPWLPVAPDPPEPE